MGRERKAVFSLARSSGLMRIQSRYSPHSSIMRLAKWISMSTSLCSMASRNSGDSMKSEKIFA